MLVGNNICFLYGGDECINFIAEVAGELTVGLLTHADQEMLEDEGFQGYLRG